MPRRAKVYIDATILAAILVIALADLEWKSTDALRYWSYLLMGLVASTRKIRVPRIRSTISCGFIFVLIGIAEFSFAETMAMAFSTGLVQCLWKVQRRPIRRQLLFNLATLANSAAAAYWLSRVMMSAIHMQSSVALQLLFAATVYFWINNLSVLTAVALVEGKPLVSIWRQCSLWSYWYFLIQATLAIGISLCIRFGGWLFALSIVVLLLGGYSIFKKVAKLLSNPLGQRRARRHLVNKVPIDLAWEDSDGRQHSITARVINISELGMGLESPEPITAKRVHVTDASHDIDTVAEVCYSEFRGGQYLIGLELHLILNKRRMMSFVPPEELDEIA